MKLLPWGRLLIILGVIVTCAIVLLTSEIKLGLDLQGGSHFLIKVHADEAAEREINNTYNTAKRIITEENELTIVEDEIFFDADRDEDTGEIKIRNLNERPPFVRFKLASAQEAQTARDKLGEYFGGQSGYSIDLNNDTIRLVMQPFYINNLRGTTVEKVRQSIEQRINTLGVSEPNIVISGNAAETQRIVLQLAGEEDPEEAKQRIQTPGRLEMRMVEYDSSEKPISARTDQEILDKFDGNLPTGTELIPEYDISRAEQPEDRNIVLWHLVSTDARVDSSHLIDAFPRRDTQNNAINVAVMLNAQGGERMRHLSRPNIGKLMAVVLDGEAISVATIRDELGSDFNIMGRFSQRDADNLSILLRSGALPASMHFMEQRSVGPALGQDSIRMGTQAFIWGLAAVALFMILYYKLSGILAVVVLSFNIVIVMAFLAMVDAVLTLPGIAGIILTIGMAVDANVIIFERIREERAVGRSVLGSVDSGFGKAFTTIFDANITTLIAAIFLFQFGTGPIKGFATTITIGILASMFTAVFVARAIYDSFFALKNNKVTKLSI
jgi:preprotein translocase subunit SecD